MKRYAIIGLGTFGAHMLEELDSLGAEVIIIDKDAAIVERYKDKARSAYITDALNEEVLKQLIPPDADGVIIDTGSRIETSILAANHLKKMGLKRVVVKAESDDHGEILRLVGATDVIFPDREAARRVTPILASDHILNYIPISKQVVLAEIDLPAGLEGKSLIEANMRKEWGVNVVSIRPEGGGEFQYFNPEYRLNQGDTLLVVGLIDNIMKLSEGSSQPKAAARSKRARR
jgi:trk system potassium uptake protein TrkA